MVSLYEWIKFLHVVAAVTFMVTHGTSIAFFPAEARAGRDQD